MADTATTTTLSLRDKLKKKRVPVDDINKFMAYVQGERHKEAGKDKKPVSSNSDEMLYTMFIKFWGLGLVIDGVNVVITGRAMAMVTYHGYKNKVKQTYPSATFDVQLVREGDTFEVAKNSGEVLYTHTLGSPFGNKPIQGAYCVVDIDGKQYLETLNSHDYEAMRNQSKNQKTWRDWESEFWLKSVIKRACKRHFYDIVVEIDKSDNDEFGLTDDVKASPEQKAAIVDAHKNSKST